MRNVREVGSWFPPHTRGCTPSKGGDSSENGVSPAHAVRTTEDVQAFVQCAYEFVQEVGFEEARRAFHEDERWRSGPIYISVDEVTSMAGTAVGFVFPPDPSTERIPGYWGLLIDVFGNDWYKEQHRLMSNFGEGWMYYSFTNPETGRDEPKASYLKSIDWDGNLAVIGAGIYRRDIPGTCESEEVNAMGLEDDPSKREATGVCPLRRDGA